MMFQLGYIEDTQHDLGTNNNDGALPISYLSTLGKFDPTVTAELSHVVPSPYAGLGYWLERDLTELPLGLNSYSA